MEDVRLTQARPVVETTERTLLDIVAAIRLVGAGGARRVVLSSLPDPELAAAEAIVHAQAAGVAFRLAPGPDGRGTAVIVGPRREAVEDRRLPLRSLEPRTAS